MTSGMKLYGNESGDSGVVGYKFDDDSISVRFHDGYVYRYSIERIGREHLEKMKRLAEAGKGLASYINHHPEIRRRFDR
jgi:hypothetical protein